MKNDANKNRAGPTDAYIWFDADVNEDDVSDDVLIQPSDLLTPSFQRSYLTSRSSDVKRGWNLSMEDASPSLEDRFAQTSIPSACPAESMTLNFTF